MTEYSVFIFPADKTIRIEGFLEKVEDLLEELKVTDGRDEDEEDWLAPGPQSRTPFQNDETEAEEGFDFCVLYDSSRAYLIPDLEGASPRCPACEEDVSAEFYEIAFAEEEIIDDNAEADSPLEPLDFSKIKLTCPGCGQKSELDQLKDETGIFLRYQYINFEATCGKFDPSWVGELSERLGVKLQAVTYDSPPN